MDASEGVLLVGLRKGLDLSPAAESILGDPARALGEEISVVTGASGLPRSAVRVLMWAWWLGQISHRLSGLKEIVQRTESPIEALLAMSLFNVMSEMRELGAAEDVFLSAQARVLSYRVDLLLTSMERNVVVECDGHDFHEKTKEQASHDKKRDRRLVAAGYQVLRFTGSDIWRDPIGCAQEALAVVIGRGQPSEAD